MGSLTSRWHCCSPRASGGINCVIGSKGSSVIAIEGKNLSLSLKKQGFNIEVPILKSCSIQIPEGQLWMLLGPNGCGKSTLLKALAGLLKPHGGTVHVQKPRSFVFQNPDHQFNLSEGEVRIRVTKALEAVGMVEYIQRPVQTLSGGQKQRVAIAGALVEASRVLLLDELTTFLDETDQIGVIEAVRNVVDGPQGVTALWVTHRLEELEYADGAIYMENGTVVKSGSVGGVRKYIRRQQSAYNKSQKSVL
ncbi:ABC transporter I family member 10 isoform X2 [Cryptomeria japonica]|uniref:ABC transporter I family member 10 isoform X2 n=1 Tax=Cryptomeria japonica TaxID=3369 RepID=UPI0027DA5EF6|nr:ABC transporter I family member 10 isoform X2 [Cryptomeria japonica]